MENIFIELSVIMVIAVIISIIMRLLKQPLMIGYIITGVIASPYFLNITISKSEIGTFAQLGIAFLLFVVGLSLDPRTIKNIGKASILTGLGQVLFTSIVGFFILKFLGFSNTSSIYISIALTFSSTIVISTLLTNKKELETLHGKLSIGFLIVQDIIAMFALITISSMQNNSNLSSAIIHSLIKGIILLFILFIVGNYILPKFSKFIAKSQEFLFLFSIAWALAIGSLFYFLNFSVEIGALLAGVTLALTPYKQEISSKMKPLRDFFIVLFFILLGSQIVFDNILIYLPAIIILSIFILIGNPLILMILTGILGYTKRTSFLLGLITAQISEFSIILISLGVSLGHLSKEILSLVTVIGLITIAISSYLITHSNSLYNFLSPYLNIFERKGKKVDDHIFYSDKEYDAILFGYNRIGYDILESFKKLHKNILVLDYNPEVIEQLIKEKVNCVYGDVSDLELLNELNLSNIKLAVSTIPDMDINTLLIKKIRVQNDKAIVIVVSHQIEEALSLYKEGASYVLLPHFLGGKHVSKMIEEIQFDISKFNELKENNIKELNKRKKLKHEHPKHERD